MTGRRLAPCWHHLTPPSPCRKHLCIGGVYVRLLLEGADAGGEAGRGGVGVGWGAVRA